MYKYTKYYAVDMHNEAILYVGNGEDETLIDETMMKPLIQGTSIAGAFRAYLLENGYTKAVVESLFGHQDQSSAITFSDALGDSLITETRTHIKINAKRGVATKGQLLEKTYLESFTNFKLFIDIHAVDAVQLEQFSSMVQLCLTALNNSEIRLGGRKTSGAGVFNIDAVSAKKVDLYNHDDLFDDLLNSENGFVDILSEVREKTNLSNYIIRMELDTKTPLMVKSDAPLRVGVPDSSHYQNSHGDYIIPGSSIKGVIKNQMIKIGKYLGCESAVKAAFGELQDANEIGHIYFSDTKLEDPKDDVSYHKIHIDKFTGGVFEGALMTVKPVTGKVVLKVLFKPLANDTETKQVIKVLVLALKDLVRGELTIGSGFAEGYGRFIGNEMFVNEALLFDFNKGINNYKQVINSRLGAR